MVLRIEDTDLKRSAARPRGQHRPRPGLAGAAGRRGAGRGRRLRAVPAERARPRCTRRASRGCSTTGLGLPLLLHAGAAGRSSRPAQLARGEMPKYDRLLPRSQPARRGASGWRRARRPPSASGCREGDVSFDDLIHGPITFSSRRHRRLHHQAHRRRLRLQLRRGHRRRGHEASPTSSAARTTSPTPPASSCCYRRPGRAGAQLRAPLADPRGRRRQALQASRRHLHRRLPGTWATSSGAVVNYLALLSWHPGDEREKFTLDEIVDRVRHRAGVAEPGHLRPRQAQLAERPLHPGAARGASWPS